MKAKQTQRYMNAKQTQHRNYILKNTTHTTKVIDWFHLASKQYTKSEHAARVTACFLTRMSTSRSHRSAITCIHTTTGAGTWIRPHCTVTVTTTMSIKIAVAAVVLEEPELASISVRLARMETRFLARQHCTCEHVVAQYDGQLGQQGGAHCGTAEPHPG